MPSTAASSTAASSNASSNASLFLVGEYHLFRECLASMLLRSERYAAVDQTSTLDDLRQRLEAPPFDETLPDAVLYDVGARRQEGIEESIRKLTEGCPELKIIALGLEEDEDEILKFIEAGASAYVLKEVSVNELISVIDQVLRGEAPCSPKITSTMFSRLADLARARRREEQLEALCLTPREIEILQYVADGLSNKEIAERLYLSFHTVKNHIHNILEKLQVRHRGQAVEYAYRKRWLKARGDGSEPRLA